MIFLIRRKTGKIIRDGHGLLLKNFIFKEMKKRNAAWRFSFSRRWTDTDFGHEFVSESVSAHRNLIQISGFMDRENPRLGDLQIGFIKGLVMIRVKLFSWFLLYQNLFWKVFWHSQSIWPWASPVLLLSWKQILYHVIQSFTSNWLIIWNDGNLETQNQPGTVDFFKQFPQTHK